MKLLSIYTNCKRQLQIPYLIISFWQLGRPLFRKIVTLYFSKLVFKARVIEVIDGDTFKGEVDLGFDVRITRHFRVFGIDTPEIFKPKTESERVKGILARDRASELLLFHVPRLRNQDKAFSLDVFQRKSLNSYRISQIFKGNLPMFLDFS